MFARFAIGLVALSALLGAAEPASALTFNLEKGQTAVGYVDSYTTRYQDTLLDVARHYDLGYTQLMVANPGIDPWIPGAGRHVVIPNFYLLPDAPRRGIVINLSQQRLYYYPPGGKTVETFPVGVGVVGWNTPVGNTRVVAKQLHPTWYPPKSILAEQPDLPKSVPPGPDNPLGNFAMLLGWPGYLIHDTNKPYGVGRNVSHGCIHLYPEDIEPLFKQIPVGTPVHVTNAEVDAAWFEGVLYVAVYPSKQQADQIDNNQPMTPAEPADLIARVQAAAGDHAGEVNWTLVKRLGMLRNGVPTPVTGPVLSRDEGAPTGALPVSATDPDPDMLDSE